jgi:hypothetical protein
MRWLSVCPDDPYGVDLLLSIYGDRIELRPEYLALRCPNCGKADEEKAVTTFISPEFRVESKRDARRDFLTTTDDFLLVGPRFVEMMREEGIGGYRLVPLPGEERFQLLLPTRVPGDFSRSMLETHIEPEGSWYGGRTILNPSPLPGKATLDHRCICCNRHFETTGFIKTTSMQLPDDPLVLCTPQFNHESDRGNRFKLFCTDTVAGIIRQRKLTGCDFWDADIPKRWP